MHYKLQHARSVININHKKLKIFTSNLNSVNNSIQNSYNICGVLFSFIHIKHLKNIKQMTPIIKN